MSIFRVFVDGELFYHPSMSKLAVTQAKLHEDAENIDSFTLSAPYNHPYLNEIVPLVSTIVCKKDDTIVFEGRAIDNGTDFYNTHTWTCESCLAYLKDTLQPPFEYSGTLRGLMEYFIGVHNAAVENKKKFTLGNITVTDPNNYIAYSNSEYSVTLDAIKDKLIDTHGGYLQIRYVNGNRYLDYLADFSTRSLQTVEFGKNLMDVKVTRDHTARATALIPLGAMVDVEVEGETVQQRVNITSVNEGRNYVCDSDAVDELGWIWATEIWDDVTLPGNLLTKANARLAELTEGITSMELTIIDESDTGADIGDIRARMYVKCVSEPHGINGTYLCVSRDRDYLNTSGNTITIGASGVTLTSASVKQSQTIRSIETDVDDVVGKVEEISSSKMYRTELVVNGVNIFRDKAQQSVISCKVYSWDKDITDELQASAFSWHRKSSDSTADAQWDASHTGTKTVTVRTEDVQDNASFFCEVTI